MKKETISQLDLNFTNSGGGHKASVNTILSAKNLDGKNGLGTVIGELGEIGVFSNEKISNIMTNFVCTDFTTNAGPNKKVINRKYIDRTSLILKSYVVLVRGVNCSPSSESLDWQTDDGRPKGVPFFSEVINTPLSQFPSSPPTKNGCIISAGKIYNIESAAKFDGVKIALCYQNKELIENLCVNSDFVSDQYKASPDLAQYELKYGYTLTEFKEILNLAGITVEGLPEADDVLFNMSGSLDSIVTAVASYLGYFWFVDPTNLNIRFISTEKASQMEVEDFTNTTNENILSASFTESTITNKIVNTYVGSAEKKESESSSTGEDRPRPVFFKRVDITEMFDEDEEATFPLTKFDLGFWFSIFNQELSDDIFDLYTYCILHLNNGTVEAGERQSEIAKVYEKNINIPSTLWPYGSPKTRLIFPFGPSVNDIELFLANDLTPVLDLSEDKRFAKGSIFMSAEGVNFDVRNPSKLVFLDKNGNRISSRRSGEDGFFYRKLICDHVTKLEGDLEKGFKPDGEPITNFPKPSSSKLHEMLKAYFEIAGTLYVSNGYSKYKVERMQFANTNNLSIQGPFRGTQNVADIDSLSHINDFLDHVGVKKEDRTIFNIKEATNGESVGEADAFYFLGERTIKKLEKKNAKVEDGEAEKIDKALDFKTLTDKIELLEYRNELLIGGKLEPSNEEATGADVVMQVFDLVQQSKVNFDAAMDLKKIMRLEYTRSKTRVNKVDEEKDEDEEDKDIARGGEGSQKESDLFDRFDLKLFKVEKPEYNLLNNLTLSEKSGTTVEMSILHSLRGTYTDNNDSPKSSTRTLYGLHIPDFKETLNSISVTVGSDGIRTTISESTIKLVPPDQELIMDRGQQAITPSTIPTSLTAAQRNVLGL